MLAPFSSSQRLGVEEVRGACRGVRSAPVRLAAGRPLPGPGAGGCVVAPAVFYCPNFSGACCGRASWCGRARACRTGSAFCRSATLSCPLLLLLNTSLWPGTTTELIAKLQKLEKEAGSEKAKPKPAKVLSNAVSAVAAFAKGGAAGWVLLGVHTHMFATGCAGPWPLRVRSPCGCHQPSLYPCCPSSVHTFASLLAP